MNKNCTILLNVKAGALSPTLSVDQVREVVRDLDLDAEVVATKTPGHMLAQVRQLKKAHAKTIAVAGGDGTVAKVVQQLAHTEIQLGILPQGTFNNFATALRLPQDLPSALRVLKEGRVIEASLGKITLQNGHSRYFTETAGVGFFADALALYGTGTNKNFWRGLKAMTRVLASFAPRRLNLTIDGEAATRRAVLCVVANSYRMAQGVPVAPGARLTDDELDIVIAGDLRRNELLKYYRAFRAQTHLKMPKVQHLQGREIHIASRKNLNIHCDDHVIGTTPATITIQPKALKVLVDYL